MRKIKTMKNFIKKVLENIENQNYKKELQKIIYSLNHYNINDALRCKLIFKDNKTNKIYIFTNSYSLQFIEKVYTFYRCNFVFSLKNNEEIMTFLNENFFEFKNYTKEDLCFDTSRNYMVFINNVLSYGHNSNQKCCYDCSQDKLLNKPFKNLFSNASQDTKDCLQNIMKEENGISLSDDLSIFINKQCIAYKNDNGNIQISDPQNKNITMNMIFYTMKNKDKEYILNNSLNEISKLYPINKIWYAEIHDTSSIMENRVSINQIFTTTGLPCFESGNISSLDLTHLEIFHPELTEYHYGNIYADLKVFEENIEKTFKKIKLDKNKIELHLTGGTIKIKFIEYRSDTLYKKQLAIEVMEILAKKHLIEDSVLLEFKLNNE